MQFGNNYLNDGHLPPEIPQTDGRGSFNFVSHRSLAVSFEVPNWSSRRLAARLVRPLTSCVTCVWWQVQRRHQTRSPRERPQRSAAEMCGRRTRLPADADPQEFLSRGRLTPENSRTRTDVDHLLKLGTRQADPLRTVSRCYSIVLTDVFDLSHPVTMLHSCSR